MTTKPRARRFRLRLSSDTAEAPPPSVAPQRAEAAAAQPATQRPAPAAGASASGASKGAAGAAPKPAAAPARARAVPAGSPPADETTRALAASGLADEDAPGVRLLRPAERRQAPADETSEAGARAGAGQTSGDNAQPRRQPAAAKAPAQSPAQPAGPGKGGAAQQATRQDARGNVTAGKAAAPAQGGGGARSQGAQNKGGQGQGGQGQGGQGQGGQGQPGQGQAKQGQGAQGKAAPSQNAQNPGGQGQNTARAGARPAPGKGEHGADVTASAGAETEMAALKEEELSAHQLRLAMRIAQRQGVKASSGIEAVRLLRQRGIDPFAQSKLLEGSTLPVSAGHGSAMQAAATDETGGQNAATGRALTTTEGPALPRTRRQPQPPAKSEPGNKVPAASQRREQEIARIQTDIVRRRRRRLAALAARVLVLVILPTLLVGWYFYRVATPLYATNAEFVIQQADAASSQAGGGLGGLLSGTGLASSQDSVTVQSYLQSREAMRRLNAEEGFKAHFQDPVIDPIRRLAPDASDEAAYRLYRRQVQISYDPTEGVVRMEVIAADPETSERFSRALIDYAEEQVDRLTQRLRENQMRDAQESFERAQARSNEAQMRVLELQESYQVLSSEVEVSLLTQQITTLEGQLNQERLGLEDLLANPRPNQARVAQAERRIASLEAQIDSLRSTLTDGGEGGMSLARVQRELAMAEAEVQTRQLLLTQALQQLEAARVEANRQVRYLSLGVSPIAPDESTYPRRFENTALAFLIFAGVYLMISMTISILREQVTS